MIQVIWQSPETLWESFRDRLRGIYIVQERAHFPEQTRVTTIYCLKSIVFPMQRFLESEFDSRNFSTFFKIKLPLQFHLLKTAYFRWRSMGSRSSVAWPSAPRCAPAPTARPTAATRTAAWMTSLKSVFQDSVVHDFWPHIQVLLDVKRRPAFAMRNWLFLLPKIARGNLAQKAQFGWGQRVPELRVSKCLQNEQF